MANSSLKINPLLLHAFSHPIVQVLLAQLISIDVIRKASDTQDSSLIQILSGVFCMHMSGAMPIPP
jgi:hypothetical protein